MEVTKQLVTTIRDIHDEHEFCANSEGYLMTVLTNTFTKRCYQGIYIDSILSVDEWSECMIEYTYNDGRTYVDVRFTVTGRVYSRGDILVGVRITESKDIVRAEYKDIAILNIKTTNKLTGCEYVNVVIDQVEHSPMQKVSIVAILYTSESKSPAYLVNGSLNSEQQAHISTLIDRIDKEYDRRAELWGKYERRFLIIENLFYAYKTQTDKFETIGKWTGLVRSSKLPDVGGLIAYTDINLTDIKGVWSRPATLHKSSPMVMRTTKSAAINYIETPAYIAISSVLLSIFNSAKAINDIVEFYDEEMIKNTRLYWALVDSARVILP